MVLLENWQNEDMLEDVKVNALYAWIGGGITHDGQIMRARRTVDFLPLLSLNKLSDKLKEELTGDTFDFEFPYSFW